MSNEISSESQSKSPGQVVDLASFRKKKSTDEEFARGRKPLYVSHLNGKIAGSPKGEAPQADFGDRLQRIRSSLDKINRLMAELKRMSNGETVDAKSPTSQRQK